MTIQINNLKFTYDDTLKDPILSVPHWSVKAKEHVFIHGPSGCGKSTLLNIICGMLPVTDGEVSVLDQSLHQMSAHKRDQFRAQHIGYVFQRFNLIPYLNAIENVQLASYFEGKKVSPSKADIEALLSRLNINPENWRNPSENLSIGQQQRVAIARALLKKPEVLIADEPTSSLDKDNQDSFMSLLMSLVEENQTTLILVSHDLSLSDHFTRVVHFNDINRKAQ